MHSFRLASPLSVAAYRRKFLANREENMWMGSFDSFAAAEAAAPPGVPVGYDDAEAAKAMYSHQICFWDYPSLFWINRSIQDGMLSIFDLGGHVGIKYYAFRRVTPYPAALRWLVCDLPGVVKTGRELAIQRAASPQLGFCTDLREASGFDVLFASGSLQYLGTSIGTILKMIEPRPRRIVLNITAVHPHRTMYTLNSIGFAVCPYRIQHCQELKDELFAAGYKHVDGWRNGGKQINVPFVEGGGEAYYAGFCLDRRAVPAVTE